MFMTDGEEKLKVVLEKIKVSDKLNLEDLKDFNESEKELIQTLYNEGIIEESLNLLQNLNSEKELQIIKKKLIDSEKTFIPTWKSLLKYAAVFIGVFASFYFFQMNKEPDIKFQVAGDYIKLEMGDGRIQFINQDETQEIISSEGEIIGRQEGGNIYYLADSRVDELTYNELHIPNGSVFNLELSDGTIVNLNSGTKIRYPIKFLKGQKREVFIDGEAFFDVAKDKAHPFIVNADDIAITVLGTKFNVSSYNNDNEINTVLVEGSVNINNSNTIVNNVILRPGMKGSWNKLEQSITMDEVDTHIYTGWISGELIFRNTLFSAMAKTLERKYNVSIEDKNEILADKVLTANFNTNIENIEEVLKLVSEIHPFKYTIKDKQIIILP